ncbi:MAG: hypothetical protein VKN72_04160 [Nostocales cyanobacterium 94392]|nr:hypothetical protein [Nostocales cyanobacterium 94392]
MLGRSLTPIKLTSAGQWNSFEQFRTSGVNALANITPGTVGTLSTKTGQYRILTESDFQHLLGIATDVERLQQGLNVVMRAVQVVRNHPQDADTLALLVETVTMLGTMSTVLPTISSFPPLKLEDENVILDSEDEVILSPELVQRPLG